MKLRLFVATAALALTAGSAFAAAGPYVGADLGLSIAHDSDVTGGTLEYDMGFGFDLRAGMPVDMFRVEGEFGYKSNDFKSGGGDLSIMTFMANGYYDIKMNAPVTPFVGLGLGLINGDSSGGSDTTFGFQLALGGSYALSKEINLDCSYKYLRTLSDFEDGGAKIPYSNSSLMVGARYNF